MNKHILMVVKWLDNQGSVTQQELVNNRDAAYRAYSAADDAAYYAYAAADAAYYVAYDAVDAANAVEAAYYAAAADAWSTANAAEKYLTKYFDNTGENRQDYLDVIQRAEEHRAFQAHSKYTGEGEC